MVVSTATLKLLKISVVNGSVSHSFWKFSSVGAVGNQRAAELVAGLLEGRRDHPQKRADHQQRSGEQDDVGGEVDDRLLGARGLFISPSSGAEAGSRSGSARR